MLTNQEFQEILDPRKYYICTQCGEDIKSSHWRGLIWAICGKCKDMNIVEARDIIRGKECFCSICISPSRTG